MPYIVCFVLYNFYILFCCKSKLLTSGSFSCTMLGTRRQYKAIFYVLLCYKLGILWACPGLLILSIQHISYWEANQLKTDVLHQVTSSKKKLAIELKYLHALDRYIAVLLHIYNLMICMRTFSVFKSLYNQFMLIQSFFSWKAITRH